jgi:predicted ABC-type transport system involved in lysophospholipase L1 biosynthesis ATPase subunit
MLSRSRTVAEYSLRFRRRIGAKILDLLFALNTATGTTLVLVTHDLEAAGRCKHLIELAGGRIVPPESAVAPG